MSAQLSPIQTETETVDVSVVMPCLNEAETIGVCVEKALSAFSRLGIRGEVVVSDNGSTDGSQSIAEAKGARIVNERRKGYGSAYLRGFEESRGRFIIMADSDDTYDLTDLERFLGPLREGYDMVVGNRFAGGIQKGAMPWHHQYIGNPLLSGFLNLLYHTDVRDAHSGMRSFTREAYARMHLQTTGMEFASEMVINAARAGLRVVEVPITYYPRMGESKLQSIPDGWRHLRFMLMYSPTHLFLTPGLALVVLGFLPLLALLRGPLSIGTLFFDFHWMVLGAFAALAGVQIICLGLFAKSYAHVAGFGGEDRLIQTFLRQFTLERGLLVGGTLLLAGSLIDAYIFLKWMEHNFSNLAELRTGLLALTLTIIGLQTIFASFFLSILMIPRRHGS